MAALVLGALAQRRGQTLRQLGGCFIGLALVGLLAIIPAVTESVTLTPDGFTTRGSFGAVEEYRYADLFEIREVATKYEPRGGDVHSVQHELWLYCRGTGQIKRVKVACVVESRILNDASQAHVKIVRWKPRG